MSSFLLTRLTLLWILSFAMGESRPSSQTQRIEAEVHDNVTLQCDLDSRVNIENNTIVCDRVDLNKKVHAYRETCKKKLEGMWSQEVEKTPTDCEMKNLKTTERDEDPPNPAQNGLNDQNRNQNKTLV
ncbi:hypothetical protein GBF38_000111 [Nibea albiflora]|nr:hypothetical protein GBF38_000111 [Nibea albiflora]